jgi:hypothetical protein
MFRMVAWLILLGVLMLTGAGAGAQTDYALRLYGWGFGDTGRVKIPLTPSQSINLGDTDFTIEFWMKATRAENGSGTCTAGNDTWISGNILLDRDIFGGGDYGDYGVSIYGGRVAFGVHNGSSGATVCSATAVTDGRWRFIALTRRLSDGQLRIFIDGALDATADGPDGDIRYREGRTTSYPNSDPFLVLGAEKHDFDPVTYPPYNGFLDELRFSTTLRYTLRYTGSFSLPTSPFAVDADTVALYRFNEGSGSVIEDAAGPNDGERRFGGTPAGPVWSSDTPFAPQPSPVNAAPLRNRYSLPVELTWQGVSNAIGYQLQVDEAASFTSPTTYDPGPNLLYSLTGPLPSGVYYWRVRAVLAGGGFSGWSTVEHFVIEPS